MNNGRGGILWTIVGILMVIMPTVVLEWGILAAIILFGVYTTLPIIGDVVLLVVYIIATFAAVKIGFNIVTVLFFLSFLFFIGQFAVLLLASRRY